MKKRYLLFGLLSLTSLCLFGIQSQADFVLCTGAACTGTPNADIIYGSATLDTINGLAGNDVIFGAAEDDVLLGGNDNDVLFGGLGNDQFNGQMGDDVIIVGPDTGPFEAQIAQGETGNDTTNVFVGEISGCLSIEDFFGTDVTNLIGFGPYSATKPFGQPGFVSGFVTFLDPIAGGVISIEVDEATDEGIETINGLPSPNVTIVPNSCLPG
jgi:Ca2+-binding RTX toxin-like protein